MADAVSTLLVLAGAAVAIWVVFVAIRGAVRWIVRARQTRRRALVEDALKHLYHCEHSGRPVSIDSLAGVLGIPRNEAVGVIARLGTLGLVRSAEGVPGLTADGRREALRVVRVHRVLERYLAERTGIDEAHWHDEADRREHLLAPEEVETLAARLGDPRFDPHGSPIPTPAGDVAAPPGEPLASLAPGQHAVVTHVEDEPEAVYAQLVAQGLTVGAPVAILESSAERLRVESLGEEQTLAPLVAANVWVRRLPAPLEAGRWRRLSELPIGDEARVVGISPVCRGPQRRRLLDLGLVPGTVVRAELPSPSGDPTGYRIRGAVIALRKSQAGMIRIEPVEKGDTR